MGEETQFRSWRSHAPLVVLAKAKPKAHPNGDHTEWDVVVRQRCHWQVGRGAAPHSASIASGFANRFEYLRVQSCLVGFLRRVAWRAGVGGLWSCTFCSADVRGGTLWWKLRSDGCPQGCHFSSRASTLQKNANTVNGCCKRKMAKCMVSYHGVVYSIGKSKMCVQLMKPYNSTSGDEWVVHEC